MTRAPAAGMFGTGAFVVSEDGNAASFAMRFPDLLASVRHCRTGFREVSFHSARTPIALVLRVRSQAEKFLGSTRPSQ